MSLLFASSYICEKEKTHIVNQIMCDSCLPEVCEGSIHSGNRVE